MILASKLIPKKGKKHREKTEGEKKTNKRVHTKKHRITNNRGKTNKQTTTTCTSEAPRHSKGLYTKNYLKDFEHQNSPH
jgi:hypothetical protein